MNDTWENWWPEFLNNKHLLGKVSELDEYDTAHGLEPVTETICHRIYDNYDDIYTRLQAVKKELIDILSQFEEVHLQSGRVKRKASLIEKVIRKRHGNIGSHTSAYAHIDGSNYASIITDLIGIRLIVNYRGKWKNIHKRILEKFPLKESSEYNSAKHLPHEGDEKFLAETPIAYYAAGDNPLQYIKEGLTAKEHNQGYRSIHYTISYGVSYVELQVRTIYDEAWSDCDHSCVYKHESNPNNRALSILSQILCKLTNVANDIGDSMHDIYEERGFSTTDEAKWSVSEDNLRFYQDALKSIKQTTNELEGFVGLLTVVDGKGC